MLEYDKLKRFALSLDKRNGEDLLHDVLMTINPEIHNSNYICMKIRHRYYDAMKKKRILIADMEVPDCAEEEIEDVKVDIRLKPFERLLAKLNFGYEVFNPKTKEMMQVPGMSLAEVSRTTGVSYSTLMKTMKNIKRRCKEQGI